MLAKYKKGEKKACLRVCFVSIQTATSTFIYLFPFSNLRNMHLSLCSTYAIAERTDDAHELFSMRAFPCGVDPLV